MLLVTERAREHLAAMLLRLECNAATGVRLVTSGDVLLDVAGPDDTVLYHQGRAVILLDPAMARLLEGSRMDLEGVPDAARLRIRLSEPQP